MPDDTTDTNESPARHFIHEIVDEHVASGRWGPKGDASVVRTRFPPEPNGYMHIGHAKSVCLNFGLATSLGGSCNLRFDDTNPTKEEQEFVDSITGDIRWLGFRWPGSSETDPGAGVLFASDYFDKMYEWALDLVGKGLAYVDDQTPDEMRTGRGTLTEPGTPSPRRDRPVAENMDLFRRMAAGEFEDGSMVLRAKIDMASPNMNLRDPVMYRVLNAEHHRTGNRWHVYPMYDWAHGLEDSIEGITHSLCTLEFEDHRPLYDWFINAINEGRDGADRIHHPLQIEFSRLSLSYVVMSKRKLRQLVEDNHVNGWDDPRMPTISGLRRRGVTPEAIRAFCADVGVTRFNAVIDPVRLENAVRDHLNEVAPRRMAVLDPLKVTITNWAEHGDADRVEMMQAINNPQDDSAGTRGAPFSGTLYIERDDFLMDPPPPKKFFRLGPDREVRLRCGYWVRCHDVRTDADGNPVELFCTYDPTTRGGENPPPDAEGKVRKVRGTLHWVSAAHAIDAEVRVYDRLFSVESPDRRPKDAGEDWTFLESLNPDSLHVMTGCKLEPVLAEEATEAAAARLSVSPHNAHLPEHIRHLYSDWVLRYQFERLGYFCLDTDARPEKLIFNRTVTLKDSWAKAAKKG